MYSKKYKLESVEEFNRHNHLYDDILGSTCYLAYLKVGERGWILYEDEGRYSPPHRVHTSIIKEINYTRDNRVVVTTMNTRFTFAVI